MRDTFFFQTILYKIREEGGARCIGGRGVVECRIFSNILKKLCPLHESNMHYSWGKNLRFLTSERMNVMIQNGFLLGESG